ncbi:hypothetical protein Tco_0366630 [Tanacetum coccineum]
MSTSTRLVDKGFGFQRWWCGGGVDDVGFGVDGVRWWGGDERGMVMDGDDEAVVGRLGTWRNSRVVAWSSVSGGGDGG